MRNIILILYLLLVSSFSFATNKDDVSKYNMQNYVPRFKLYKTENMWTFLKLDTSNGLIWQVQYDVGGSNRMQVPLNSFNLVYCGNDTISISGRYTLEPTKNIYNFLLLDQVEGLVWQVQWNIDPEKRGIVPID